MNRCKSWRISVVLRSEKPISEDEVDLLYDKISDLLIENGHDCFYGSAVTTEEMTECDLFKDLFSTEKD